MRLRRNKAEARGLALLCFLLLAAGFVKASGVVPAQPAAIKGVQALKEIPSALVSATPSVSAQTRSSATPVKSSEIEEFRRSKLEREVQESVIKWAQWRFWSIAAGSLLIGFFGVRSLVREMIAEQLRDAMRATAQAEAATQQARDAVKKAQVDAELYGDSVSKLRKTADDVQGELDALRATIDAESVNARDSAAIGLAGMQQQIDKLSSTVEKLIDEGRARVTVVEQQQAVKKRAEEKSKKFLENSKIRVSVEAKEDDTGFADDLRALGYKTVVQKAGFIGIPPNTILYKKKEIVAATEISKIAARIFGEAPEMYEMPYKGISARFVDLFYFPKEEPNEEPA